MFNARRSALFVAIIGLGFAAGEASAACSPSSRVGGILVCMKAAPGSLICDTEVQLDPACIADGPEGCNFGNSAFNSTTELTSACSYTGASFDGDIYPPPPITLNWLRAIPTAAPNNAQRNGPKKYKCVNGWLIGTGKRVPCTTETTDGLVDALFTGPGLAGPVGELGGVEVPMNCGTNGVCKSTQEILPTGLFCSGDRPAIDATPLRDSSFIVKVEVESSNEDFTTAYFGCLGSAGNGYSCEALESFGYPEDCIGSSAGGYGESSGKLYCETGALPASTLICGAPTT